MRKLAGLSLGVVMLVTAAAPAFAAEVTAQATTGTQVIVDKVISIDAPALIDFGHAVPSDTKTKADDLYVVTNSENGYTVTAQASDLQGNGRLNDKIAVSNLSIGSDVAPAAFADAATAMQIVSRNTRTAQMSATGKAAPVASYVNQVGDALPINLSLDVPFVESGTYTGNIVFVAATK